MKHRLAGATSAIALCLPLAAQANVVVNEVLYDPTGNDAGKEIIEIANLGSSAQDLSAWALCVSASAPGSRVYWNFPAGTTLAAGAFVQVRWQTSGVDTATEIFTGTPASGPCGNPMLALDNGVGAVSIYRSQSCIGFFSSGNIVDFVQWGGPGTIRESVAVGAGIWPMGTFFAAVREGHSIAYTGSGNTPNDYFDDACPTPGSDNSGPGNALATSYGSGCAGALGAPTVTTVGGPPALGNRSFAVSVDNVLAGSPAVAIVGTSATSFPIFGCTLLVTPLLTVPGFVGTPLAVPVGCSPGQVGTMLFFQWAVLDGAAPQGIALSDGLRVTL